MSQYDSLYTPNKKVPANIYIAQLICENEAQHLKILLPDQYLKIKEWASFYYLQLKKTNEYLEKYHEIVLINVIKSKKIYNLLPKWIENEFNKEHEKQLSLTKNIIKETSVNTNVVLVVDSLGKQNKDLDLGKFDV